MKERKENTFGLRQEYDPGDKVRVWRIFKNPVGTIESVVEFEASPIKYMVRYIYEDTGETFIEEFESSELTLVERGFMTWSSY